MSPSTVTCRSCTLEQRRLGRWRRAVDLVGESTFVNSGPSTNTGSPNFTYSPMMSVGLVSGVN